MRVIFIVLVICVSASLAKRNDRRRPKSHSHSSSSEESSEVQAQEFIERFNLTFASGAARDAAIKNLIQADQDVKSNNQLFAQKKINFLQEVYPINIMTNDQIVKARTGLFTKPSSSVSLTTLRKKRAAPQSIANTLLCTNPPAAKNWVTDGKVSPPQDQGNCNNCYIFAGVSALESAVSIKYGTAPLKLSEQQLTDCIRQAPYGGCNLGRAEWVWNPTKTNGGAVAYTSYNPYTATDTNGCNNNIVKAPNTIVDLYLTNPQANEVSLKCALNMYGPHAVSMDFSGPIVNYKSGIYDDPTNNCNSAIVGGTMTKPYNHAVSLVGYGSELNNAGVMTDYWLIKNSWGTWWGMGGYIKIARNKNNLCHVATDAAVPILLPAVTSN